MTEQDRSQSASDDLVSVARVARTRGLKGEVVADLLTDFPERFEGLDELIAVWPDGQRQTLLIEDHWFQRDRIILKFSDYDSIDAAKGLVGCELAVSEQERIALAQDHFYDWELTGCEVRNVAGDLLGRVREVMRGGGVEMLVVENDSGGDSLIPMAHDICVEIDVEEKLIRVDPPPGLLEL